VTQRAKLSRNDANNEPQTQPVKSRRALEFAFLLGASLVVAWRPVMSTLRLAAANDGYTHILLILPISLAFLYVDRRSLRIDKGRSRLAFCILAAAIALYGLSRWQAARLTPDLRLSIDMLALVSWWIGSFVFCVGTKAARSMVFPLCFLYWMVPLPAFALGELVRILQQGSALATRFCFLLAGVPLTQDGLLLTIPGLTIEVGKECSSIRSSLMLVVTTMVLAQLMLRSPARKALVITAAAALSVVKNGFRIFVIAMLGTRVDSSFLTGKLHHQGGIVFFALALLIIFLLLWAFGRAESTRNASLDLRPSLP